LDGEYYGTKIIMILKLVEKKIEASDVTSFIFNPEEMLSWKAGQFLHYVLHHEPTDDRGSDRWFTVAAAPYEGHVMVTTRYAGEKSSSFKKTLFNLNVGDTIEISTIDGDFVVEDVSQEYVFIAGGIGVTPFRAILKQLRFEKKLVKATLLYANRDEHIVFKDELEELAKENPGLKIHYVIAPERIDGNKIREVVADLQKPIFYVSGPEPMVDALSGELKQLGVQEDRIKGDWFPGYPLD
jgi:ferredoxin-NADP reductase